jgi:hypothetical protein
VGETTYVPVDFADKIGAASAATISSVAVTCEVLTGTDASASSRISGSPQVSGTTVQQRVTSLQEGVTYLIRFAATLSDGRVEVIAGRLPVVRES